MQCKIFSQEAGSRFKTCSVYTSWKLNHRCRQASGLTLFCFDLIGSHSKWKINTAPSFQCDCLRMKTQLSAVGLFPCVFGSVPSYLGFSSCWSCAFWPRAPGGRTAPSCRWGPAAAPSSCRRGRDLGCESLLDGTWGRPPAGEVRAEGERSEERGNGAKRWREEMKRWRKKEERVGRGQRENRKMDSAWNRKVNLQNSDTTTLLLFSARSFSPLFCVTLLSNQQQGWTEECVCSD